MVQFVEDQQYYEGSPIINLNIAGIDLPDNVTAMLTDHPELLQFNTKTFYTFVKHDSTDPLIRPINRFFEFVSVEDQREIVSTLILMNALIKQDIANPRDIRELIYQEGQLIYELDKKIKLCHKFEDFIHWQIHTKEMSIADMSNAGTRAIDRADMTFHLYEIMNIEAMFMLSKMFAPIAGEFYYRHAHLTNSTSKDIILLSMYTSVLMVNYARLVNKIQHYIQKLAEGKARDDVVAHYNYSTPLYTAREIFALIIVKKAPAADLNAKDSNLAKFIAAVTKSTVEAQQKSQMSSERINTFTDPKDGDLMTGNEETNSSRIETESANSSKPVIIVPAAATMSEWLVKKLLSTNQVSQEVYDQAKDWYTKNPTIPNPITIFLLASYFGPELGGAQSVEQLTAKNLLQLTICMQCLLLQMDSLALVHILTSPISSDEKMGDLDDFSFTNSWKASPEYSKLRKIVVTGFGETMWDAAFKEHATLITTKKFYYHTAPVIWNELINTAPESYTKNELDNGSIFDDNAMYIREEMNLMQYLWTSRKLQTA